MAGLFGEAALKNLVPGAQLGRFPRQVIGSVQLRGDHLLWRPAAEWPDTGQCFGDHDVDNTCEHDERHAEAREFPAMVSGGPDVSMRSGYTGGMRHAVTVFVLILWVSASGSAQDRTSAFVGGSISAANMASHTDIAYAGSFGYRFSRVVSFVIEATAVPDVRSSFPANSPFVRTASGSTSSSVSSTSVVIFPGPFFANPGGRIVLFTNAARVDIPTTSTRVTPFFTAGGGVANVRRTADFSYPFPLLPTLPPGLPIDIRPITQQVTASSTEMTLTLGGGVGVRVASSLWVDADLRVFRLFGDEDRNLGRFGVGVRYAF